MSRRNPPGAGPRPGVPCRTAGAAPGGASGGASAPGGKPRLRGRAARLARLFPGGPGGGGQAARTPFVLLVVVLLGGGLITLLVLNSALSAGSFRLDDLERQTRDLTDEEQALQRDVDAYSAPDALQRRAGELGMVPGGDPAFLGPDGKVRGVPGPAAVPPAMDRTSLVLPSPAVPPGLTAPQEPSPGAAPPGTAPSEGATAPTAPAATSGYPAPGQDLAAPGPAPTPTATPPTPTPGR